MIIIYNEVECFEFNAFCIMGYPLTFNNNSCHIHEVRGNQYSFSFIYLLYVTLTTIILHTSAIKYGRNTFTQNNSNLSKQCNILPSMTDSLTHNTQL